MIRATLVGKIGKYGNELKKASNGSDMYRVSVECPGRGRARTYVWASAWGTKAIEVNGLGLREGDWVMIVGDLSTRKKDNGSTDVQVTVQMMERIGAPGESGDDSYQAPKKVEPLDDIPF